MNFNGHFYATIYHMTQMLVRKPSHSFSDYIEWFITSDYYINININNKKKSNIKDKISATQSLYTNHVFPILEWGQIGLKITKLSKMGSKEVLRHWKILQCKIKVHNYFFFKVLINKDSLSSFS